jgi:hypothetical protein
VKKFVCLSVCIQKMFEIWGKREMQRIWASAFIFLFAFCFVNANSFVAKFFENGRFPSFLSCLLFCVDWVFVRWFVNDCWLVCWVVDGVFVKCKLMNVCGVNVSWVVKCVLIECEWLWVVWKIWYDVETWFDLWNMCKKWVYEFLCVVLWNVNWVVKHV